LNGRCFCVVGRKNNLFSVFKQNIEALGDLFVNMEHLDDPMLARKEVQKIRRSGTHLPSTSRKSKKMSSLSEQDESKDVKMPAEDSFEVEKVIDKKLEGFEKYYLVLWKGWPE
jgi:hypothetical protein